MSQAKIKSKRDSTLVIWHEIFAHSVWVGIIHDLVHFDVSWRERSLESYLQTATFKRAVNLLKKTVNIDYNLYFSFFLFLNYMCYAYIYVIDV